MTEEQIIHMAEQAVAEMADGTDPAASLAAADNIVLPDGPIRERFALFVKHFTRLIRERFGNDVLKVH
jgi:hypothetical protein